LSRLLVIAAALVLAAVPVAAGEAPTEEWDGLVRQSSDKLDNVWVRPDVQFKAYRRVRLPPVEVSFAEDWDPNRGSRRSSGTLTNEDILKIRTELSEMFHKEFSSHLAKGGYVLAESNDDDVLIVQAALANVYIHGPEGKRIREAGGHYTMEPGRVSVVMQLSDSVTQQLLARVVDTQEGFEYGNLTWNSSIKSSTEVQRILDLWAYELRKGLDRVNESP
jgi:Protein of unknown function (DUF3313)